VDFYATTVPHTQQLLLLKHHGMPTCGCGGSPCFCSYWLACHASIMSVKAGLLLDIAYHYKLY